ncbi:hypothetical protein Syun_013108 [Stephania yunnanensis]|uniref:Uncharacterized protein n=1 Tax=Stephania yunnanensis TaxID=152371 RepID=A0AAP0PG09_9MAGN
MSKVVGRAKRAGKDSESQRSEKKRISAEDFDLDISSDIKGIISALHQIRERAQKDDQKKSEETIASVALDISSMLDDAKSKLEKDRQSFAKTLLKSSKECELSLKDGIAKFQAVYERLCKEKALHLQAYEDSVNCNLLEEEEEKAFDVKAEDMFNKYEAEKKKLLIRYEQQRKREKAMLSELEKACGDKIAAVEGSLRKKKQDDKCFNMLRKSLGSFLESELRRSKEDKAQLVIGCKAKDDSKLHA